MADSYSSTALTFRLPHKEAQTYALDLQASCLTAKETDDWEHPELLTDIPEEFRDMDILGEWDFEVEPDGDTGLYIFVSEGFTFVDALCKYIQHLLRMFDPSGFVQFEWSHVCTKMRPGCFSGGAAHITATTAQMMATPDWLEERAQKEAGQRVNRTYGDF